MREGCSSLAGYAGARTGPLQSADAVTRDGEVDGDQALEALELAAAPLLGKRSAFPTRLTAPLLPAQIFFLGFRSGRSMRTSVPMASAADGASMRRAPSR